MLLWTPKGKDNRKWYPEANHVYVYHEISWNDDISSQHNFIFSTFRNLLFNFRRKVEKLLFPTVRSHNTMVLHIKLAEISRMIAF